MPIPSSIQLQIVSADRSLVNEQADEIQIPGAGGYFGVLPGHTPLLATLQVGQLWYRQGQDKHYLSLAFGFAEVQPDRVTILAQIAEKAEEIDVTRAEAAKKRKAQQPICQQAERAQPDQVGDPGLGIKPRGDHSRCKKGDAARQRGEKHFGEQ